jgi:hypothetical protein
MESKFKQIVFFSQMVLTIYIFLHVACPLYFKYLAFFFKDLSWHLLVQPCLVLLHVCDNFCFMYEFKYLMKLCYHD